MKKIIILRNLRFYSGVATGFCLIIPRILVGEGTSTSNEEGNSFIHQYSALEAGLAGTRAQSHCILGRFLGVVCNCFPPPLDVPTFAARCLCVRNDARDPSRKCGREICPVILPKLRLPRKFRDLLHAANLRHGTDGFTSPPKEGVLRIFCNV